MDSYRSLLAWQVAHQLVIKSLRGIDDAWHPRCGALLEQLRRAVISIEANIVEGYALGTRPYLLKHARIAFGSAAEAEVLFQDAAELEYLPVTLLEDVQPLVLRSQKLLRGLLQKG
jgi:four helix bundle protein